jgi:hypothetical protein
VEGSKQVVEAGFEALKGLDPEAALQALGSLGAEVVQLPKVGRVISKGIDLALRAIQKIRELCGSGKLDSVQEHAKKLFESLQGGVSVLDNFLRLIYGLDHGKARVYQLLEQTSAAGQAIDAGAEKLDRLRVQFAEQMALVFRIIGGLRITKGLASFLLPQATTVVPFGIAYLLAMNYAVVAALDFADRPSPIDFVDGVIRVSEMTLT